MAVQVTWRALCSLRILKGTMLRIWRGIWVGGFAEGLDHSTTLIFTGKPDKDHKSLFSQNSGLA